MNPRPAVSHSESTTIPPRRGPSETSVAATHPTPSFPAIKPKNRLKRLWKRILRLFGLDRIISTPGSADGWIRHPIPPQVPEGYEFEQQPSLPDLPVRPIACRQVPSGDEEFADLRRDIALAARYGVHGFCFRVSATGLPILEALCRRTDWDTPFCVCGGVEGSAAASPPLSALADSRALRIDGKPLWLIAGESGFPGPEVCSAWRDRCRREGIGEILLIAVPSVERPGTLPPGFDAILQRPGCGGPSSISPPNDAGSLRILGTGMPSDEAERTPSDLRQRTERAIRDIVGVRPFLLLETWDDCGDQPGRRRGFARWNALARAVVAARDSVSAPRDFAGASLRQAPIVSVVVPTYNHETYVAEALESIRRQRLDGLELDVVIIDDGSRDGTRDVVRNFLAYYPDFPARFIAQENAGAHAAINRGVALARGHYVTILNSDDRFEPDRIVTLYETLIATGQGVCFTDFEAIDERSRPIDPRMHPHLLALRCAGERLGRYPSLGYFLLTFNCTISTGNHFFTRKLFDRIGGYRNFRIAHDWDFVLAALEFTAPIRVDRKLYGYRLHAANTFATGGQELGQRESLTLRSHHARRILAAAESLDTYPLFVGERKEVIRRFLGELGLLPEEGQLGESGEMRIDRKTSGGSKPHELGKSRVRL